MKRMVFVTLACLIATGARAKEPYEGTWDDDLVQCFNPESQSSIVLREKEMGGYEQYCKFQRTRKTGSTITVDLACEYADEPWKETIVLDVRGMNSLIMTRNKHKFPMMRCPSLPEPAQIEKLIDIWININASCRGGSGRSAEKACKEREVVSSALDAHDMCYGKEDQVGADMEWHKCTSGSVRPGSSQ